MKARKKVLTSLCIGAAFLGMSLTALADDQITSIDPNKYYTLSQGSTVVSDVPGSDIIEEMNALNMTMDQFYLGGGNIEEVPDPTPVVSEPEPAPVVETAPVVESAPPVESTPTVVESTPAVVQSAPAASSYSASNTSNTKKSAAAAESEEAEVVEAEKTVVAAPYSGENMAAHLLLTETVLLALVAKIRKKMTT
jgi:hypothetical protein